jgi:hypothetical protein
MRHSAKTAIGRSPFQRVIPTLGPCALLAQMHTKPYGNTAQQSASGSQGLGHEDRRMSDDLTEDDAIRGRALILSSENPQLVVAAPDLLAALTGALEGWSPESVEAACAAIARATGTKRAKEMGH